MEFEGRRRFGGLTVRLSEVGRETRANSEGGQRERKTTWKDSVSSSRNGEGAAAAAGARAAAGAEADF